MIVNLGNLEPRKSETVLHSFQQSYFEYVSRNIYRSIKKSIIRLYFELRIVVITDSYQLELLIESQATGTTARVAEVAHPY